MIPVRMLLILVGFLWASVGSALTINPPLFQVDAFKVITLEGEDLPFALGVPIADLSLAAIVDGEMRPVPFQIDQFNVGGAVYFEGWDVPLAGDPLLMDKTDKLLFLFKDSGERRKRDTPYDGEVIAEILTRGQDGFARFVYLVKNSRLRSDDQYVRYSSEIGLVDTDFYSLRYNTKNHLVWEDFDYVNFAGDTKILEALKLGLNTGIVTPFTGVELDNDSMVATPTAEKIGPIRTTTQLNFDLYLFGVSILQLSMQIHHYPKAVIYDVRGIMPQIRRMMLINPELIMSLDASNHMGASILTAAKPGVYGIMDGEIDAYEKEIMAAEFDRKNNWIWFNSKQKMDILAFVDYMGDFDEPLKFTMQDTINKEDKSKQFLNAGYKVTHFPTKGFIGFAVSLFFNDRFRGDPEHFTAYARTLPEIEIRSL